MTSSLLLWLLSGVLWHTCCAQTCSTTAGHAPGSSCHRSKPCRAAHQFEEVECIPNLHSPFPYPPSNSLPDGITRCPRTDGGMVQNCPRAYDGNETLLSDNRITSVSLDLNSIDYMRFAVNISWNHSFNPTCGYEIRVRDDHLLLDCYCVNNQADRNLYLNDQITYPPFTYRTGNSGTINVEVGVLSDLPAASPAVNAVTQWPRSCLDIIHTDLTCALPVYHPPSNVVAYSHPPRSGNLGGVFDIRWQYQTAFVNPTLFYVSIYNLEDEAEYYTFAVNNTNSIEVSNMISPLMRYHVQVQAYVPCSGLANRTYSLGCGERSTPVSPITKLSLHHRAPTGSPRA